MSVPTASAKKRTLKRDDDVAPSIIFKTVMTKLGISPKRICREGSVQFREGFFFLRLPSQFGRLRAQETIQETRSGDKSPTLKVATSSQRPGLCRGANGSCPPRLVVGCVGLRSRVCIVQHIYQPPTATPPTAYNRRTLRSPSISAALGRERVRPKSALRSERMMARRSSSAQASHPLNTSPSRT